MSKRRGGGSGGGASTTTTRGRSELGVPGAVLIPHVEDQKNPSRVESVDEHSSSSSSIVVDVQDQTSSTSARLVSQRLELSSPKLCEACSLNAAELWCEADQAYFCEPCDNVVHSANAFSSRHERLRVFAADEPQEGDESRKKRPRTSPPEDSNPTTPGSPDELEGDNLIQDVDLFLHHEDSENESSGRAAHQEQQQQAPEEEQHQQQQGLIVPPAAATCGNLNELLGWREFDSGGCDSRFDFAIKNNARLLPPAVIDGPDSFSAFREFHGDSRVHHREAPEEIPAPAPAPAAPLQIPELRDERLLKLRLNREEIRSIWHRPMFLDEEDDCKRRVPEPVDSISDAGGSSDVGVVPDLSQRGAARSAAAESIDQAGQVPVIQPDHHHHQQQQQQNSGGAAAAGGREARVSRYREKRRTRLFSKKIRYEVRKLNAERRPRLKGRFVKRSSPAGSK